MKIAFFSTYLPASYIGGAEILTELVARGLVRNGHDVSIFTGGKNKTYRSNGILIRQLPIMQPVPMRTVLSPLRRTTLKHILQKDEYFVNADIVHSTDIDSLVLLASWDALSRKLVATIQDYGMVCPAGDLLYGQRQCPNYCHRTHGFACLDYRHLSLCGKISSTCAYGLRKYIRDRALLNLRYAICVSQFVRKELLRIAPHIHTCVVGNCVSSDWLHLHRRLSDKNIDVLYVGRYAKHKGVDVLLRALASVSANRTITARFMGDGDFQTYRKLINAYGLQKSVTILKAVPHEQVFPHYQRAIIVAVPSIWPEPCGRTIIEGMAAGCAVVATHTGGTPESIHDGVNGVLVPPGNSEKLADAIQHLLQHPERCRQLGYNAKKYAKTHFLTQRIVQQYEDYYRLILTR